MKKTFLLLPFLISVIFISGCSDIDPIEYNDVVAEKVELQNQLDEAISQNNELQNKLDEITDAYNQLASQIETDLQEDINYSYIDAWASVCFGDDTTFMYQGTDYLECLAGNKYSISQDSISEIWQDFVISCGSLSPYVDQINFKKISVKFFSEEGPEIIEIVLKRTSNSYELESILGNMYYGEDILAALEDSQNN